MNRSLPKSPRPPRRRRCAKPPRHCRPARLAKRRCSGRAKPPSTPATPCPLRWRSPARRPSWRLLPLARQPRRTTRPSGPLPTPLRRNSRRLSVGSRRRPRPSTPPSRPDRKRTLRRPPRLSSPLRRNSRRLSVGSRRRPRPFTPPSRPDRKRTSRRPPRLSSPK